MTAVIISDEITIENENGIPTGKEKCGSVNEKDKDAMINGNIVKRIVIEIENVIINLVVNFLFGKFKINNHNHTMYNFRSNTKFIKI